MTNIVDYLETSAGEEGALRLPNEGNGKLINNNGLVHAMHDSVSRRWQQHGKKIMHAVHSDADDNSVVPSLG